MPNPVDQIKQLENFIQQLRKLHRTMDHSSIAAAMVDAAIARLVDAQSEREDDQSAKEI